MTDSVIKRQPCSACGRILDRSAGDGVPVDGDVSICLYCQHPMVFQGGQLRDFTLAEIVAFTDEDKIRIAKAQELARIARGGLWPK